jgi:hypothetical protein
MGPGFQAGPRPVRVWTGVVWDTSRGPPKTSELDPFLLSVTISNPSAPNLFFHQSNQQEKKAWTEIGTNSTPADNFTVCPVCGGTEVRPSTQLTNEFELAINPFQASFAPQVQNPFP